MDILKSQAPQQNIRTALMFCWLMLLTPISAVASSGTSNSVQLLSYTLHDLNANANASQIDLNQYLGTPALLIIFEPQCPWCFKQIKVINQLWSKCPNAFQPLAIGVHGNRKQPQLESRRLRAEFPTLQASAKFLQDLGTISGTPLLLISDSQGYYQSYHRGYVNSAGINRVLASHEINCTDPKTNTQMINTQFSSNTLTTNKKD